MSKERITCNRRLTRQARALVEAVKPHLPSDAKEGEDWEMIYHQCGGVCWVWRPGSEEKRMSECIFVEPMLYGLPLEVAEAQAQAEKVPTSYLGGLWGEIDNHCPTALKKNIVQRYAWEYDRLEWSDSIQALDFERASAIEREWDDECPKTRALEEKERK